MDVRVLAGNHDFAMGCFVRAQRVASLRMTGRTVDARNHHCGETIAAIRM